jgi:hypothetical protein
MSNITKSLAVRYPDDVAELRASISLLQRFTDVEIDRLYERYSDTYCAGWLILSPDIIEDFAQWLTK